MQETRVRSLGQEDPLEKGMATHSRILAWRIPWTEEPGGLQPMNSQRVGHNLTTNTSITTKEVLSLILKSWSNENYLSLLDAETIMRCCISFRCNPKCHTEPQAHVQHCETLKNGEFYRHVLMWGRLRDCPELQSSGKVGWCNYLPTTLIYSSEINDTPCQLRTGPKTTNKRFPGQFISYLSTWLGQLSGSRLE